MSLRMGKSKEETLERRKGGIGNWERAAPVLQVQVQVQVPLPLSECSSWRSSRWWVGRMPLERFVRG